MGGQVYQQAEIEYGHFERRIPLGFEVTGSSASASYEAGLLRITLPIVRARAAGRSRSSSTGADERPSPSSSSTSSGCRCSR